MSLRAHRGCARDVRRRRHNNRARLREHHHLVRVVDHRVVARRERDRAVGVAQSAQRRLGEHAPRLAEGFAHELRRVREVKLGRVLGLREQLLEDPGRSRLKRRESGDLPRVLRAVHLHVRRVRRYAAICGNAKRLAGQRHGIVFPLTVNAVARELQRVRHQVLFRGHPVRHLHDDVRERLAAVVGE